MIENCEDVNMRKIEISKLKFVNRLKFSPEVMQNCQVEIIDRVEYALKEVYIQIDIPYEKLKTIEINIPANWFEHFKETYFPNFLLKHFPVKYKTITKEIGILYPQLPLIMKENVGVVCGIARNI